MISMKNNYMKVSLLAILLCFISCEQEKIMMYEQVGGVVFTESVDISFSFFGLKEGQEPISKISASISGNAVDYDRAIKIALYEGDETRVNTARPEQYEIIDGIVPAGSFTGTIPVKFNYTEDMSDSIFVFHIQIMPNDDFPVAGYDHAKVKISVTDQVIKPTNWRGLRWYFGEPFSKSWYEFILGVIEMDYIPYGTIDIPESEKWSYDELTAYVAKVKSALNKYNKDHKEQLRHSKDGDAPNTIVEMP